MKRLLRIVLITLAVVAATSATFVPEEREQDDQFEMDNVELAEKGDAEDDNDLTDQIRSVSWDKNAFNGGVYIRWGKFGCPSTASKVYGGIAGASRKKGQGGGSNYLCLTEKPEYNKPHEGIQERSSKLYAVEYRTDFPPLQHLNNHYVPCVVCQVKSRRLNVLMVPGRNKCPAGWTFEYGGYLMSERSQSHYRTEFVCVDEKAKGLDRISSVGVDATMQTVEGVCSNTGGGLPCESYVNGNELTCAVCSN